MRPVRGVQNLALEPLAAGNVRWFDVGEATRGRDHEPRGQLVAVTRLDGPEIGRVIEGRLRHGSGEAEMLTQVEPVGDMAEIAEDLRLLGIAQAPRPILRQ